MFIKDIFIYIITTPYVVTKSIYSNIKNYFPNTIKENYNFIFHHKEYVKEIITITQYKANLNQSDPFEHAQDESISYLNAMKSYYDLRFMELSDTKKALDQFNPSFHKRQKETLVQEWFILKEILDKKQAKVMNQLSNQENTMRDNENKLESVNNQLRDENNNLKEESSREMQLKNNLTNQITGLTTEVEKLNFDKLTQQKQIEEQQSEIAKQKVEIEVQQQQIREQQGTKLQDQEKQRQFYAKAIEERENIIEGLQKQLEESEKTNKSIINGLDQKNTSLFYTLTSKDTQIQRLESQLRHMNELNCTVNKLKEEKAKLELANETLKKQVDSGNVFKQLISKFQPGKQAGSLLDLMTKADDVVAHIEKYTKTALAQLSQIEEKYTKAIFAHKQRHALELLNAALTQEYGDISVKIRTQSDLITFFPHENQLETMTEAKTCLTDLSVKARSLEDDISKNKSAIEEQQRILESIEQELLDFRKNYYSEIEQFQTKLTNMKDVHDELKRIFNTSSSNEYSNTFNPSNEQLRTSLTPTQKSVNTTNDISPMSNNIALNRSVTAAVKGLVNPGRRLYNLKSPEGSSNIQILANSTSSSQSELDPS